MILIAHVACSTSKVWVVAAVSELIIAIIKSKFGDLFSMGGNDVPIELH